MAQAAAKKTYTLATGRRKTSVARIRLAEGTGLIQINGRSLEQVFTEEKDRAAILGPLLVADMRTRLDVVATVHGGGITGQAGAISQGVARALKTMFGLTNEPAVATSENGEAPAAAGEGSLAKRLRDSGFLTRDSRMKERKKYGRKGARKSFQFSKR
ncbi:MAG: 30S ribosomal protein S9 [Gemmataceae bacterium]